MKVTHVVYRRKFNLGNYETEDVEVGAEVEDGESPTEVLDKLKDWVLEGFLATHAGRARQPLS
jgi:hypothetical protein